MHKTTNQCPECNGEVFADQENGEEVCTTCGLVTDNFDITNQILYTYEDQQYPSHNLAIGKNLGTLIEPRDLWTILQARSTKNVPFRYNMIQSMLLDNKGTTLTRMLVQGSRLCKTYGLGADVTFSNYYGTQIRRVSTHIKQSYCNTIAKALFIIAWQQTHTDQEKTREMMLELGITTTILHKVSEYLSKNCQNVAQRDVQKKS